MELTNRYIFDVRNKSVDFYDQSLEQTNPRTSA